MKKEKAEALMRVELQKTNKQTFTVFFLTHYKSLQLISATLAFVSERERDEREKANGNMLDLDPVQ